MNPQRDLEILKKFSVLYLEDESVLREQTAAVLEDFVRVIHPVSCCAEAAEVLSRHPIDVIVTDILLQGENGLDCLGGPLKERASGLPTIVTTAYTDTEFLLKAIKLHVNGYIVKPINIKELLNTLHDVLLPRIQEQEINRSYLMIKLISLLTEGKQVDLARFILDHLDEENMLNYSYNDLVEALGISKPTIIKFFRQLSQLGILIKIKNGKYFFDEMKLLNA